MVGFLHQQGVTTGGKTVYHHLILRIGPMGSHLGEDAMAGYEGTCTNYLKTIGMQHVGEFQQGIVIVAIAINSYCYGFGMLSLEALEAFYGHCGDATGIDGDSHDQHIFGGYLNFS